MKHLLDRLVMTGKVAPVDAGSVDRFVGDGPCILFFTGDAERRPETSDVAVVLRELVAAYDDLRVGIVERADEDALARRFGVDVTPSVVELREGKVQGVLARIQAWSRYTEMAARVAGGAS